jgi:hypothetical protein
MVTAPTDFMRRLDRANAYRENLVFTKEALVVGFVFSMASIPMMVFKLEPVEAGSIGNWVLSAWLGFAVAMLFTFIRMGLNFFTIADNPPPRPPRGG